MVRGALLLLLLTGCSSNADSTAPDLAVPVGCTLVFDGEASHSLPCNQRLCRSAPSDNLQLWGIVNGSFQLSFSIDGGFTPGRAYATGDLTTFLAETGIGFATTSYAAGSQVPGSTVTLTFTSLEPNDNLGCASGNVTAHGTTQIGLIEQLDADAGTRPPGHLTAVATF